MKLSVALQAVTDRKQDVGKLLQQRLQQTRVDQLIRSTTIVLFCFVFLLCELLYCTSEKGRKSPRLKVSLLVIASPPPVPIVLC